MFALQLVAAVLLVISGLFFFGPTLIVYGRRGLVDACGEPAGKFVGGCLASAFAMVLVSPYIGSAAIGGGEVLLAAAINVATHQF